MNLPSYSLVAALALLSHPIIAAAQTETFPGPAQAKRGFELFFAAPKGQPCGACHVMQGKGTAVAPDLTKIARLPPRAFVMSILSTRTQYAVSVKPKTGEKFPAMKVKEVGTVTEFYDLSKTPPELVKIEKDQIDSVTDNTTWKHPPESMGYTKEQLADIIAYIKWVGYRSSSAVKPGEL